MTHDNAFLPLFLALSAALAAFPADAGEARLKPEAQRITDEAIDTDLGTYEATQGRIKALNDTGRPIRDYHLSKAQCWLDVSFHEYTRNDRSDFPQAALDESVAELQIAVKAGTATTIQYVSEQTLIKYRLEKLEAERDRVSK